LESSKYVCERGVAFSPGEESFRKRWAGFVNRFEERETPVLSDSPTIYVTESRIGFRLGRFRADLAQHCVKRYIDCESREENRADVAPSAPIGLAVEGIGVDDD
jgi:hypothetical protein